MNDQLKIERRTIPSYTEYTLLLSDAQCAILYRILETTADSNNLYASLNKEQIALSKEILNALGDRDLD